MNNRRKFLKEGMLASLSVALLPGLSQAGELISQKKNKLKHWVWTNPDLKATPAELAVRYKQYYEAGIRGIFFEHDSEKHFRAAKAQNLEAHYWIWTMNRGEKSLLESHPEWYAKNRKGESCATHPPYVDYYRWLCPSKEEVRQYLEGVYAAALKKEYVDGIHLDYVRYSDVILPVNLWADYKLVQTTEAPEFDYCYCETCQAKYKKESGITLSEVEYPEASPSWRQFRYQQVNQVVERLTTLAAAHKKPITAAVFPTPDIARRNVKQDWVNWNISGVCPMIYHGFYKENVSWIGTAVAEGVKALQGKCPLYAGLYLPDFKNNEELTQGISNAIANGAAGVSLFGEVTASTLNALKRASAH